MTSENTSLTNLTKFDEAITIINNTNTISDARRIIAIAQGMVETARKLYNPTSINTIAEADEDKTRGQDIAKNAGGIKLYAEARLGELIKIEQEAGRLASPGINRYSTEGITKLQYYNLTAKDSYHAQQMAEHKDIIAKVIVDSLDIPTRAAVEKEIKNQQHEAKKAETTPVILPEGIFDVIAIDPPWPYGGEYDADSHRIESPYKELTVDEIASTNIPSSYSKTGIVRLAEL